MMEATQRRENSLPSQSQLRQSTGAVIPKTRTNYSQTPESSDGPMAL
jgi:hypothetical protein